MTNNRYSILVLWSDDDSAFLAKVFELPGCMAHGDTQEEAVQNILIAIESWLDTATELGRPIPHPMSLGEFEKQTAQQAQEAQRRFQAAVQDAVQQTLAQIVPQIAQQFQYALFYREQGGLMRLLRGEPAVSGAVPTRVEDLELHTR